MTQPTKCVRFLIDASADQCSRTGPRYASISITQEMLDKMYLLQKLCDEHGLREVRVSHEITWGRSRKLHTYDTELVMTQARSLWFTTYSQEAECHFTTDLISFDELVDVFGQTTNGGSFSFMATDNKDVE